jgi:site-specific DNA recombinase
MKAIMRAVIYARYSTDNQRVESIEDQFEVCRRYIVRMGWTLTGTYDDAAISGSSRFRPGFQRLLADAEARRFDVVVCEAVDRLSRKLADTADFHDRLGFAGVKLHATNIGEITPIHVGVMGMMAQAYISDLKDKTKRGQLGRARAGKVPGGIAYGYEVVAAPASDMGAGDRRIIPGEAEIVRRIFREYGAGKSSRMIAHELNAANIPGPGGRPWGDTTIRGQTERGTGILNNTLYIGQLSWNRCSYVKDPRTGKRLARINPQSEWEITAVPALRIVDQTIWDLVRARHTAVQFTMARDAGGNALNRAHRRVFLLSGLLKCGCCGGTMTIVAKDRYGCATYRGKGTCINNATILQPRIEARILGALQDRMVTPELVAEFIRTFEDELSKFQRERINVEQRLRDRLGEIKRKTKRIITAIENGAYVTSMNQELRDLEAEETRLNAELAATSAPAQPIKLHPNAAELYRAKVADLGTALNAPDIRLEAAEALQGLIEQVVLTPDATAPDGMAAELFGDLAEILLLASDPDGARRRVRGGVPTKNPRGTSVPGGILSVVAGTRFELMTFRL